MYNAAYRFPNDRLDLLARRAGPARRAADTQGSEVEPNNTCATAQNVGAVALPFSIRGSLDPSPEAPDVDYFRLTGPAGARWLAHLEGAATGQGTLSDHNLGWFDSTCSRIDRSGTTLAFAVPADGVVILAVSRFDDSDFVGSPGFAGSYLVTVSPEAYAASVSGRVIDGETGAPLAPPPGGWLETQVELRGCGATSEGWCGEPAGRQYFGADGLFEFSAIPVGRYQVVAQGSVCWLPEDEEWPTCEDWRRGRSPVFTLGENQAAAIGDVLLFPYCPLCDIAGVTSAAVLDGDLGEWSDFAAATLDRDTAATIQGAPPERADLSGTLRWAWDAAGLYLALHVTDDALVHDSADLAQDDVFELAIDGDGDNAGGGPGDHLYRITHDGRQSDHGVATQALRVAARTVAGGWDLEIVIPAGQFAPGGLAARPADPFQLGAGRRRQRRRGRCTAHRLRHAARSARNGLALGHAVRRQSAILWDCSTPAAGRRSPRCPRPAHPGTGIP